MVIFFEFLDFLIGRRAIFFCDDTESSSSIAFAHTIVVPEELMIQPCIRAGERIESSKITCEELRIFMRGDAGNEESLRKDYVF